MSRWQLRFKWFVVTFFIGACLSACGGGGGDSGSGVNTATPSPTSTPITNPISSPTPTSTPIPNPTSTPTPTATPTPIESVQITVQSVSASSFSNPYTPENTIDLDTADSSRWSAEGIGEWLQLDLGDTYTVNALDIFFYQNLERNTCFNIQTSNNGVDWVTQRANIVSNGERLFYFATTSARYIRYDGLGNSDTLWNSIIEVDVYLNAVDESVNISDGDNDNANACIGEINGGSAVTFSEITTGSGAEFMSGADLDANVTPNENFDLSYWKITYPAADGDVDPPAVLANAFYTDDTNGAMVFECVNRGGQTSSSTKYSRSELREMVDLTRNSGTQSLKNNWVISTASVDDKAEAGGVDGNMKATLAVNRVSETTTAGDEYMLGRVIVGQIHASDDEPFKIYYRKLPGNDYGAVYFSYEDSKTEVYFELIGTRDGMASSDDGIALDEKWAYEVDVVGRDMTVTVIRENGDYIQQTVAWDPIYDHDWFYFKAGNYNQNDGGDDGDYAQVSFFRLDVTHDN